MVEYLENLRFTETDIAYLEDLGYPADFIAYLKDFKLELTIRSAKEGDLVLLMNQSFKSKDRLPNVNWLKQLCLTLLISKH